jgi:hypothetical protein
MPELNEYLREWMRTTTPSAKQRRRQPDDIRRLMGWAAFYGLQMPVSGDDVAAFLLELMADGASLQEIQEVATSIMDSYERHEVFLSTRPIKAALALAEAQLSPDRILN